MRQAELITKIASPLAMPPARVCVVVAYCMRMRIDIVVAARVRVKRDQTHFCLCSTARGGSRQLACSSEFLCLLSFDGRLHEPALASGVTRARAGISCLHCALCFERIVGRRMQTCPDGARRLRVSRLQSPMLTCALVLGRCCYDAVCVLGSTEQTHRSGVFGCPLGAS